MRKIKYKDPRTGEVYNQMPSRPWLKSGLPRTSLEIIYEDNAQIPNRVVKEVQEKKVEKAVEHTAESTSKVVKPKQARRRRRSSPKK